MQHIPDKEFDKLVKDKFKELEIEPSANLWANIENELVPKRKRIIPIFWMVAASLLILIGTMLLYQKTEKIQLHGAEQQVNNKTIVDKLNANDVEVEVSNIETKVSNFIQSSTAKIIVNEVEDGELKNTQLAMQPIIETERLPIKQQEVMQLAIASIKEIVVENPIVIAQVINSPDVESYAISESDNISERKGIRNVGDLVNFVVDKVDKRDKKLLKFNTDDDDNSSLVALNIGFLKFNKKNK